jgi:NAD(P)-dependent dehydrogenase (short-subunit alcohol dehydrogenase family)
MAGKAVGLEANCAKVADILKLVDYVKTNFGKLDILVCNAGTSWGSWFDEAPEDASDKILNLNVKGVFHLAQKFAPLLEKAGTLEDPSRIIIVSSVAGVTVSQGGPNGTIMYNVSKAAAHHLARNLAVELGPRNITTNTIAPGFFPSKLANGLIEVLGGDELIRSNNPRRRLGEAEDMAALAIYLCSRAGSYVNGADIPLDGGARYLGRIAHPKSKI